MQKILILLCQYDLLQQSKNYSVISGSFCNYCRNEINDDENDNDDNDDMINNNKTTKSKSFKYKKK